MGKEDLQDLLEITKIEFPEPLTIKEVDDLFEFISMKTGYDVLCAEKTKKRFLGLQHQQGLIEGDRYIVEDKDIIDCYITDKFGSGADSGAFLLRKGYDSEIIRFYQFEFNNKIPGYNLEEHPEEIVKMWKDTKKYITEYFQLKKIKEDAAEKGSQEEIPF